MKVISGAIGLISSIARGVQAGFEWWNRPLSDDLIGEPECEGDEKMMHVSDNLIRLLKGWEGYCDKAYKCPAGVWTIGYGHTAGVKEGDSVTPEQADYLLKCDLEQFEAAIWHDVRALDLTQAQFDALVSFAYNVGVGNWQKSTLRKLVLTGQNSEAAGQFECWNKGGGKVLPGLVKRRRAEREMWLFGRYTDYVNGSA